jgi:hypothetical protein
MAVFTIDLYVGYKFFIGNDGRDFQAAKYAISVGAREACRIASLLDDDSPPRIVVRAHLRAAGESVVLVQFTATNLDEIDAAKALVTKWLGLRVALKAILRVPQAQSQELLPHDAR